MVIEVTAWTADDGSIHTTKLAALQQDAVTALSKMDVFNHASALAVVKNAAEIAEVLIPLVVELEALEQERLAKEEQARLAKEAKHA